MVVSYKILSAIAATSEMVENVGKEDWGPREGERGGGGERGREISWKEQGKTHVLAMVKEVSPGHLLHGGVLCFARRAPSRVLSKWGTKFTSDLPLYPSARAGEQRAHVCRDVPTSGV